MGDASLNLEKRSRAGFPIGLFALLASTACAKVEPVDQANVTSVAVDAPQSGTANDAATTNE